jgi:non-heme chloroperoxidase
VTTRVSTVTLDRGIALSFAAGGDSSGAPVVFLPGPTDSWRSYEAVLERLPPSIRSVAVSQRGHGDSDKPANGYRVEDFAADAVSLLDALEVDRAVLVGHSGSCLVARSVAIEQPDRVAGVVLEASPLTLSGDARLTEFVESVVSRLDDPIDAEFARSFVADTSAAGLEPGAVEGLVTELLKVPARVWHEMFGALLRYDDTAALGRVRAPARLIWGDRDTLVSRQTQQHLRERLPDAELVVYQGIGHTPRWEDPTRFAHDVAAFVERVSTA